MHDTTSKNRWDSNVALFSQARAKFGKHWVYNFRNDPKRLGFVFSRYKFASKMACKGVDIIELGCGDGIGATVLAEHAKSYTGIDLDKEAIESVDPNLKSPRYNFRFDDFMGITYGSFGAVVSLDVIEHILPEYEPIYLQTIASNCSSRGICVIGTPNVTAAVYGSEASKLGHVNNFSQERLVDALKKHFHTVLPFGMNDETVHTGYAPMAHYLICVGCDKKC